MVLSSLLGGAMGYGRTAFGYNFARYTYDTNMRQKAIFKLMDYNCKQWDLFREDIKDLCNLATVNMKSYMLFGTMFLGFSVGFLRSVLDKFPPSPPWLLILWGNCIISGICYGLLGVWFAVHGNIAACAASAQMLTQAIRPPIPTPQDIERNTHNIAEYEGQGAKMVEVPNLLGVRQAAEQVIRNDGGESTTPNADGESGAQDALRFVPGGSRQPTPVSYTPGGQASYTPGPQSSSASVINENSTWENAEGAGPFLGPEPSRLLKEGRQSVFKYITEAKGAQSIFDQLGEPIGSSPGPPATLYGHVRFFQEMQTTYAPFHAYAQVCLHASVCQVLFAFAYYVVAESNKRFVADQDQPSLAADLWPTFLLWFSAGFFMFTCLLITKIDLYVPESKMRVVKTILILGPIVASCAVQLDALRPKPGSVFLYLKQHFVYPLVTVTCIMHALHTWLLLVKESEPAPQGTGGLMVPTKFRAVQNLDVTRPLAHSYHAENEGPRVKRRARGVGAGAGRNSSAGPGREFSVASSSAAGGPAGSSRDGGGQPLLQSRAENLPPEGAKGAPSHAKALSSARRLQQSVARILDGEAHEQLTSKELRELTELKEQLLTVVTPGYVSFRSVESMGLGAAEWMQADYIADSGLRMPYYVNFRSGEVSWELPEGENMINLTSIQEAVQGHVARLTPGDPSVHGSVAQLAAMSTWSEADSDISSDNEPGTLTRQMSYRQRKVVNRVLKGPNSRKEAQEMPWIYFRQLSMAVIFIWVATVVGSLIVQVDLYINPPEEDNLLYMSRRNTTAFIAAAQPLKVAWPHDMFSPSAVACAGQTMLLGDRFEIYTAQLPTEQSSRLPLDMRVWLSAKDFPAPWSAFTLMCGSGGRQAGLAGCSALLLLEMDGSAVWEISLPVPADGEESQQPRRWPVGAAFDGTLRSITVASPEADRCADDSVGADSWALLGTSDMGEAVVFCPQDGQLQPARLLATRNDVEPSVRVGERGDFWNLDTSLSLPAGHRWAQGLCELSGFAGSGSNSSIVVAGVLGRKARLYRFDVPS